MKTSFRTRRLQMESLESRQLMAGNVFVNTDLRGDLMLRGDAAANGVEIRQLGTGQYRIDGLITGGSQTRIWLGGVPANSQTVTGISGNFDIQLQAGDDYLLISAAGLPGGQKLLVPHDLNIHTDDGNDRVYLTDVHVRDEASIYLGANDDYFWMYGGYVGTSTDYEGSAFDHILEVYAGSGTNFVGVSTTFVRNNIFLGGGDGSDYLYLTSSFSGESTYLYGEGGDDRIDVSHMFAGRSLTIYGSAGNDSVTLDSVTASYLQVFMDASWLPGGDHDRLRVGYTHADSALFDGGTGVVDIIQLGAGNVFTTPPTVRGFEL